MDNCQIMNDLNKQFNSLSLAKQTTINKAFNNYINRPNQSGNKSINNNKIDLNKEISMEFRFLNGQRLYMKAKLNEIFKDVFKRFHENECPSSLKAFTCSATHNGLRVDKEKTLYENDIKDKDIVAFFNEDTEYKNKYDTKEEEKEEEEEEESEDEDEDDDDEKDKLLKEWRNEYIITKFLGLIRAIENLDDGETEKLDVEFDPNAKDFLKFLSQKFKELGMKIKEHEHKVIYTITNYDWKCNECKENKSKGEPRLYCSICDYNMCNTCRKDKKYYKMGNIPKNVNPSNKNVKKQFIKPSEHKHRLAYCRTKRTPAHGGWFCDKCKESFTNRVWTFYCTQCDYDLCYKCAKQRKLV